LGDNTYVINYGNGDGVTDEITLTAQAIPEPGTWASVFAGFGMLVLLQRNRRRKI
jgi:hypothetical protein